MHRLLSLLLLASLALGGCATTRGARKASPERDILDTATYLLGMERVRVRGRSYRSDCSGFVSAAFSGSAVELMRPGVNGVSATERMYRTLKERGALRPSSRLRPGDLLFFHNTWDRNNNGLRDDLFTHVALVEGVEADGTVTYFHFATGRVKRGVMNLKHQGEARDPESGKTWNSPLRRGRGRVLAGQLFFRAGNPLKP